MPPLLSTRFIHLASVASLLFHLVGHYRESPFVHVAVTRPGAPIVTVTWRGPSTRAGVRLISLKPSANNKLTAAATV